MVHKQIENRGQNIKYGGVGNYLGRFSPLVCNTRQVFAFMICEVDQEEQTDFDGTPAGFIVECFSSKLFQNKVWRNPLYSQHNA